MMKRFSKIICMVMVIAMSATCLFGCGKTDVVDDGLTVINVWTGDTGSKMIFEQVISEYNETIGKENGIKIVYEAKENISQTITVALQTKQAPEIFMAGSVAEYSEQGYIVALDDLPGGKELIEKRKEFLVEEKQSYKGKTYSIPFASTLYGLVYNKDMFKKAGLVDENGEATPPKTLKELREYAKILTNPKEGKYGIVFPLKWTGMFGTDFGNTVIASSGRGGYDYTIGKYDFSSFKDVLETIMQIKEDKSFMPGAEGLDNDPARSRFAEGNIGMKFSASWDVGVFNDQFPAKCDWGIAPFPVANESERYYQAMGVNTGYKISADAVEKVGAEKLMIAYEYLVGDELARKLFEYGANMPVDESIIESANKDNFPKGWEEYSEILNISKPIPRSLPSDISGETSFEKDFINNVWSGKKTLDEAIADANRVYNAGAEKYISLHSDCDVNQFIIPDYNSLIK